MGDVGDDFRAWDEYQKAQRAKNLEKNKHMELTGWTKHTEWHWSMTLCGAHLDFWPTKNKWRWRGHTYHGNVETFIRKRLGK